MTPEQLAAIKARAEAAHPGPWIQDGPGGTFAKAWFPAPDGLRLEAIVGTISPLATYADVTFIAHAREDVPALVAEVERLTQALLDLTDGSGERAGDLCAELTRTRAEVERLRESSAHVCKIWHRQNSGSGTRPTTAIGVAIRDMGKSIGWKP